MGRRLLTSIKRLLFGLIRQGLWNAISVSHGIFSAYHTSLDQLPGASVQACICSAPSVVQPFRRIRI